MGGGGGRIKQGQNHNFAKKDVHKKKLPLSNMDICRNPLCRVYFEEEKSSYYSNFDYQQRKKI